MNKEVEKVLNEMALCDFRAPMKVTITVEESDDDEELQQGVEKNKKPTCDNFYECPTPLIGEQYIHHRNLINDLDETPLTLGKNTCQIPKKSGSKRKSPLIQDPKSKRVKTFTTSLSPTKNICSGAEKETESSLDSLPMQKGGNILNKSVNDTHIQMVNNTNNLTKTEVNNFVEDLLTKVSKAILYVIEAYRQHIENVLNKPNDILFIQDSKKRYARIKQHYFQLAYCATDTIILSQESNDKFTEEFLNNTIKIGKELTKRTLTRHEIQPFYYELLYWVKNQKKCCQVLTPSPSTQKLPILNQLLSEPPKSMQSEYQSLVAADKSSTQQKRISQEYQPAVTVNKSKDNQATMPPKYQPVATVHSSYVHQMVIRPDCQPIVTVDKSNTQQKPMRQEYQPETVGITNSKQMAMRPEYHQPVVTVHKSNDNQMAMQPYYQPVVAAAKSNTPPNAKPQEYQPVVTGGRTNLNQMAMQPYYEPVVAAAKSNTPPKAKLQENQPVVTVGRTNLNQMAMQPDYQPVVAAVKSNAPQNANPQGYPPVVTVGRTNVNQMMMQPEYQPVVRIEKSNTVSPYFNTIHSAHINISIKPRDTQSQNQQPINWVLPPKTGIIGADPKFFYNDPTRLRLENCSTTEKLTNMCNLIPYHTNIYTHNVSNGNLEQHVETPPAPPYHSQIHPFASYQATYEINPHKNNDTETTQNIHVHTECRRSESTDSGIFSPHQFNSPVNQVEAENLQRQQLAPIITHVTSLNPNALRLTEGPCHVCGKLTAKKCLQCYGSYYCSYDCQKADWVIHQLHCGKIATRNEQQINYK